MWEHPLILSVDSLLIIETEKWVEFKLNINCQWSSKAFIITSTWSHTMWTHNCCPCFWCYLSNALFSTAGNQDLDYRLYYISVNVRSVYRSPSPGPSKVAACTWAAAYDWDPQCLLWPFVCSHYLWRINNLWALFKVSMATLLDCIMYRYYH